MIDSSPAEAGLGASGQGARPVSARTLHRLRPRRQGGAGARKRRRPIHPGGDKCRRGTRI